LSAPYESATTWSTAASPTQATQSTTPLQSAIALAQLAL